MMKKFVSLFISFIGFAYSINAQTIQRHKIAIFAPLYLDSAFDISGNSNIDKAFPKFLVPGLEFYQGAELALDSLKKRGAPLEIFIYDSKSTRNPIAQQLNSIDLKDVEMVIGQTNAAETKLLAEAALRKKIPFISATLPNDAGIDTNPYFVVLNSTLQSHVEGIYRFLQKYHSNANIIVYRKPGTQEDQLKNHFIEFTKSTVATPLNIQYVDIGTSFSAQAVASKLDSNRKNICIAGSLDEAFGTRLLQTLATLNNTYTVTAIGMPTWENMNLAKSEITNLEIIYTVPFYYNRSSSLETQLVIDYTNKMSIKPSDIFLRGYETTLRFALLLLDTKKDIASNITRKGNYVFTQFDIQPVFKNKQSMELDYFENKHLYFIKVLGGVKNILQ